MPAVIWREEVRKVRKSVKSERRKVCGRNQSGAILRSFSALLTFRTLLTFRLLHVYLARHMKKNLFIAFEGIDGSGKSTQVKLLQEKLEAAELKVYTTCEPTDGPIG